MIKQTLLLTSFAVLLAIFSPAGFAQEPPEKVIVLPMFVVAAGQKQPSSDEKRLLMKHLRWSQKRYREMLGNRSTFEFETKPKIFKSKRTLKQYQEGKVANLLVEELFDEMKVTRFSCKYIFLAVFVNPDEKYPHPGGRPLNGGFNTGGGVIVLSTRGLKGKNLQSTLQHELGHSFGLTHVDTYGYDMKRNASVMSYNKAHHTKGGNPSKTPGILIPEDIRGLALNDRVFKDLEFDEQKDVPPDYELQGVRTLGPPVLPNSPMVKAETTDGEQLKSSVQNIVHGIIKPSVDTGKITFHKRTMWHSSKQEDGIVTVNLTMPVPTTMDRIKIYSQHSGKYHGATGVEVSTVDQDGKATKVAKSKIDAPDGEIKFDKATSQQWKLEFRTGKSKTLVLRGLRFFNGDTEMYAPLVPPEAIQ